MKDVVSLIETIINLIEDNLLKDFNLDKISKKVFVSKYHMHRLFKNITGFGIMEYATLRRLSLSVHFLLYTNKDIGYIANYFGFSGSQAYIRAFKRTFFITPMAFRVSPSELKIYERYNIELLKKVGEGCIIFPEIKVAPGFSIAGSEYKINVLENQYKTIGIEYANDFFFYKRKLIKKAVSYSKYIGYSYVPNNFTNTELEQQFVFYMPSIIVNKETSIPSTMKMIDINTQKYAVFKYVGFHDIRDILGEFIFDVWEYILFKWMPSVDYKQDDNYCFEFIDYEKCDRSYCEIKFYLPIA
jgi:AraC family transcriptional regulator